MSAIDPRANTTNLLNNIQNSGKPEFVALYGRRRIGKTHLIRDYFSNKKGVLYFDVSGSKDTPMNEQIIKFTTRMSQVFYNNANLTSEKNWNLTFNALTHAINNTQEKTIVLFFDEFPWMATKNSRLLQNLDYYWNQFWSKDARIKLVICGSSASWIIDKIVNNKGGLHNRMTHQIHLKPFTLLQTKQFLQTQKIQLNNSQITQLYMVTGGVPYYLLNIQAGLSAAQNIDQLAFKDNALLLNEFDNLFSSLFDNYELCVAIIRLIAKHREGIGQTEIFHQINKNLKGKKGITLLKSIEDAGFIMSFSPQTYKKKGIYYKVIDEYTLFYLRWIEPIKSSLRKQSLEEGYWQLMQTQPTWQSWSGYAFESICYKHISPIKKVLQLSPIDLPDTWRFIPSKQTTESGTQIDLLFDRHDDAITLCEIKYTIKPFIIDKAYAENLKHKLSVYQQKTKTQKQLFLALISANGVKNNFYADELITAIVTLDDLFQ